MVTWGSPKTQANAKRWISQHAMTTRAVVASPLLNLRLLGSVGAVPDSTWESLVWELITTISTVILIPTLVEQNEKERKKKKKRRIIIIH
jgi:hypothetical protein